MNPVATNSNLARLAEAAYERRGDYASLLFEGHWHRSGELFERSRRVAGGLAELGIAPGERVVVSVVGRPDERYGEEIVAFLSLNPTGAGAATADELIEWARDRIGGHKYPREVRILDSIPLTAVGKLDRKSLRGRLL